MKDEIITTSCDHYIDYGIGCNFRDGCIYKDIPQITCWIKEDEAQNIKKDDNI